MVGLVINYVSLCYLNLQSFVLEIAGERLTKRMRLRSFRTILRQEIGWFDQEVNSTGALSAKLACDASGVKGVSMSFVLAFFILPRGSLETIT